MSERQDTINGFQALLEKMSHYQEALALIAWDLRTGAPKKGVERRAKVIGTLSGELFSMQTSDEMAGYLDALQEADGQTPLDDVLRRSVEKARKEFDKYRKIPKDMYREYVELQSIAESVWEEAKPAADFKKFEPYLEKIVRFNIEFAELWGYEENRYDALLDQYEPGVPVSKIDGVFAQLRENIVRLLEAVQASPHQPDTSFIGQTFPVEGQRAIGRYILEEMGYDFDAGRLDVTVHPFAISLNPGDVRVTTKYDTRDFRTALFGTIHEGGHALYEQNISIDLLGTPLCTGTSMGIHESQSLFWENFIGRSYAFWSHYYDKLVEQFPQQLKSVDLDAFYRGINVVKPSLIRIEADELTYALHIMVRYEIEKGLINEEIRVSDLPEIWNDKMQEYLGVVPSHDGEGVLQDVHWSGGSFGYFPSYALGYIYAAQFLHKLGKDLPDYERSVAEGDLSPVKAWLAENIHRHGAMYDPRDLLRRVTGEDLDARHLVAYLEQKYRDVYRIPNEDSEG